MIKTDCRVDKIPSLPKISILIYTLCSSYSHVIVDIYSPIHINNYNYQQLLYAYGADLSGLSMDQNFEIYAHLHI